MVIIFIICTIKSIYGKSDGHSYLINLKLHSICSTKLSYEHCLNFILPHKKNPIFVLHPPGHRFQLYTPIVFVEPH